MRSEHSPIEQTPPTPDSHQAASTEFLLLNEIAIIDQLAEAKAEKLLSPQLNMPQFIVLNHLARRGQPSSLVALAGAIQVTKGAMTNSVTKLLNKALVSVQADPHDGRGKLITLTAAGQLARTQAVQRLGMHLSGLSQVLTSKEQAQMQQLLVKMRTWFDTHRGGFEL